MRDGWREIEFGELATLEYGKALKEADRNGGPVVVVGSAGIIGHHDMPLISGPAIIIGRKGNAGAVHIVDGDCWPIDTTFSVRLKSDLVDWRWLAHWCAWQDLATLGQAGARPGLNRDRVHEIRVRFPPLDEQRRLVDLLASVGVAHHLTREQVHRTSLARATIGSALWSDATTRSALNALGEASTGKTPSTKEPRFWDPGEIPFVTPTDFDGRLELLGAARSVSVEGAEVARLMPPGTVAQVCIGATLGKAAVLGVEATANQQVNCISGLDRDDAIVLATLLSSPSGRQRARELAGQTTMPILKKSAWESWEVPWPTREVRQRLAALLESVDRVERVASRCDKQLDQLDRSIRQTVISGSHGISNSYDRFLGQAGPEDRKEDLATLAV